MSLDERFECVVVMLDHPSSRIEFESKSDLADRALSPLFHVPPQASDFGELRKAAFEYARLRNLDQVILMDGDGGHPPESLPELLEAARRAPESLILATADAESQPIADRLWNRVAGFIQNRILGLHLGDYQTRFRVYPLEALERIPFQLNTRGKRFDSEIILQMRALGVRIHEVALSVPSDSATVPGAAGPAHRSLSEEVDAIRTAIGYRLHQAHLTRDGRYLVDHDIHYTLKHSETGSHHQVITSIAPGSEVLDLGCSTGLLARPLLEKEVRVTGVDAGEGKRLAKELAEYHQRDLELPLELPFGRDFDYVVCADVIEHLRNRNQLLRGARRYLKPGGRLVISTPNVALWFYRLSLLVGRFEYGPRGVLDETHVHLYTGSTFRREVENAGFHVLEQKVTALPFEVVFESTGRSRLVRGIAATYHALARLWPAMFAYQYVLEARITTLDEESVYSRAENAPAAETSI